MIIEYNNKTGLYEAVWRGERVAFSSNRMTVIKLAINCFNI